MTGVVRRTAPPRFCQREGLRTPCAAEADEDARDGATAFLGGIVRPLWAPAGEADGVRTPSKLHACARAARRALFA